MNGLHDLLATIRKIEEAEPAVSRFQAMNPPDANGKATVATPPTATTNPYANDPKQSAIYSAMSPEDQAWATKGGGKPDLTDPYIAARAPNKFKPVTTAPTATAPTATAPTATAPTAPAPTAPAPTATTTNPEVQKKIDRIKQIIGSSAPNAQTNTTIGPNMGQINKDLGNYSLVPPGTSSAGLKISKEGIVFKSKIGLALLEYFDIQLDEATSPREELDALWSELQQGLQSGLITGPVANEINDLGAEVNKFQQANPLPNTNQTNTGKPPAQTNTVKPTTGAGRVNPGTRAYQHWLNAHGVKVAVNGSYGPETKDAGDKLPPEYKPGSKKDAAKFKEYMDMLSVGTAYNVLPGQGPGTMSLGDPGWLDAMKKYGFDPKTGDPIGGKLSAPPNSAQKVDPKVTANAGSPELDTTGSLANPPVAPGTVPLDQLTKAIPTPKSGDTYWINGNRYRYQVSGGGRGGPGSAKWVYDYGQEKPETMGGITSNQTSMKRLNKYTGIGESAGYSDDELNRLISLVHHR